MKKNILTWIITIVTCFAFADGKKQNNDDIKIKKALKDIEQQIALYKNDVTADKTLKSLYEEKGKIYRYEEKYKQAYVCYLQVLKYAQKTKEIKCETEMIWLLFALADAQNKPDLVLSLSEKFKDIIEKRFFPWQMRDYYSWKGFAHLKKNKLDKALQNFKQVIKLLNKENLYYKYNCIYYSSSISIVFSRENNFKKSLEYLNKAADSFALCITDDKAIHDYFNKALTVFEKCNPPDSVGLNLLYQKIEKNDLTKQIASDLKLEAKKEPETIANNKEYPESYAIYAKVLKAKGNYIEAVKVLREGLNKVNNKRLEKYIVYVHEEIIDLFLKAKRIDMAIKELDYILKLIHRRDIIVSKIVIDCVYDAVVKTCKQLNDDKITSKYYQIIIDSREQSLKEALSKTVTEENIDDVTSCFHDKINILQDAGRYDEAMETAKNAIDFNIKNLDKDIFLNHISYEHLADLLVLKQEYTAAIKVYEDFLKLSKIENDKSRDISIHFNMVKIYIEAKDFHLAAKRLEIIARLNKNLKGDGEHLKNLNFFFVGTKYMEIKKYKQALFFLKKALVDEKKSLYIKWINDAIKIAEQKIKKK